MDERIFAGEYRVVRELGSDPAGRTLLATGPHGGQYVVRVVRPPSPEAVDAMEHTVALMSGIRHPALAAIHEWGHEQGEFFVVREFITGVDLKTELELQGRFAPLTVARYGAELAGALEQIHERGIAYGDVSTANMVRLPTDGVKLVGGGMGETWEGHYVAPERVEGAAPTRASDIYALGVVLYELVSGRTPFAGATPAEIADHQLHEVPEPVGTLAEGVPASLEGIIMRALEKAPAARWATAGEMAAALERVEDEESPLPTEIEVPPPPKARGRMWALLAVLLVAGALVLAWAMGALPGSGVTTPDLVGMTSVDARAAVLAAGLQVGDVSYSGAPVAGMADGLVAQQTPAAGARAQTDDSVDMVLSGLEVLSVPDVAGITEAQALAALADTGLAVGAITRVTTTAVAAGIVTSQTPDQGARAAKGSRVDLWVAEAPVVTPVPDVVGMTHANANNALIAAGFVVASVNQASATMASGRIIDQVPTAGVAAQTGSTVTIRISTGPSQTTVPNVEGMKQAAAVNALSAAGFLTQVTTQTGGGTVGNVIDQSPNGGTKATTGSTVVIKVVQ